MSELQNKVEQIIKNHITYLTTSPNHKKSSHMERHYHTLLGELYNQDEHGIIFVNHFGHIEYMNPAFSNYFMLDKYDQSFNNILNLNRLPIDISIQNHRFHLVYPNKSSIHLSMTHQLVHFQTSTLLQFKFTDVSAYLKLNTKYLKSQSLYEFYMTHIDAAMFLMDHEGFITHVATPDYLLLGQPLNRLEKTSIFEYLPFDYATELLEHLHQTTPQTEIHFLYEYTHNKATQMLDTTLVDYKDGLSLCYIRDVSDLNAMSSTLEYLTDHDALTGFYNTAYYNKQLTALNDATHMPLSIYVLTIQGLKELNRQMGHTYGDNHIIELALKLQSFITQHEKPCRISGDTFIIFFPNHARKSLDTFLSAISDQLEILKTNPSNACLSYNQDSVFLPTPPDDLSQLVSHLIP